MLNTFPLPPLHATSGAPGAAAPAGRRGGANSLADLGVLAICAKSRAWSYNTLATARTFKSAA